MFTLMCTKTFAVIHSESIEYKSNEKTMQSFLSYDTKPGVKPGILIVHDWMGLGSFTENKAKQLASMGYVALAVDVYGKEVRPKDQKEASQLASLYKDNRPLLEERMKAAYNELIKRPQVDKNNIYVMGYCFGGTSALELARTGVPLAGTVSFHGGLANPNPDNAKNIKGKVLILHGADDPFVNKEEVEHFRDEMKKAGKPYEFIAYPGAVHGFTNPTAGSDNSKGMAYNKKADQQSWVAFEKFLKESRIEKK